MLKGVLEECEKKYGLMNQVGSIKKTFIYMYVI